MVVDAVEEEGEKGEGRYSVVTCREGSAGALVERGEVATGARTGRPERNDDDDDNELDPFGDRAAALVGGKPCRSLVVVGIDAAGYLATVGETRSAGDEKSCTPCGGTGRTKTDSTRSCEAFRAFSFARTVSSSRPPLDWSFSSPSLWTMRTVGRRWLYCRSGERGVDVTDDDLVALLSAGESNGSRNSGVDICE